MSLRRMFLLLTCLLPAWLAISSCSGGGDPGQAVPESLAGLERVRLISGKEALDKIDSLHGRHIEVEEAAIGIYGRGEENAMVWVSRAGGESDSADQAMLMVEKMKNDPSRTFTGAEILNVDKHRVYRFQGMGRTHYIFTRDDLAYWISVPPDTALEALQEFF